MRPVDYVERGPSPAARRELRRWRVFFICLVICQLIAVLGYDIGFWWVMLASLVAYGLFELFWAVFDRRNPLRRPQKP
ncbi:hypothetical protein [Rhodococcus sp. NPDC076796]|uniref:hypothetical protein n=1 Tax=Rhodococcus sp. NPDC076796 TaxID=3154859 RepID=UPI00344C864E